MNWVYKGKEIKNIEDLPKGTIGFIYKVTHIPSGKNYIGKKILFHSKKVKLGKKELKNLEGVKGRPKSYKIIIKESDWKSYYGSEENIKKLIKEGKELDFERNILKCVNDKKLLTYFECKYQFNFEVLEKPNEYFNNNILGKFFTKDFNL